VALKNLSAYFFDTPKRQVQTRWFKKSIYVLLAIKCCYWLLYFGFFFGPQSGILTSPFNIAFPGNLAYLLYSTQLPWLNALVIIGVFVLCLWQALVKPFYLIGDAFIWLAVVNLHNATYPALSGGDYLLNQFLFFNCLLFYTNAPQPTFMGQLKVLAHNTGVIAVLVQVSLAYFVSALYKLVDATWLNGTAIDAVGKVRHFGLYYFPAAASPWPLLSGFLTYFVLCYQLLFPALAWLTPIKKPFLLTGVAMHLYIAVVMGLPLFATTMVIGYCYFWPLPQSATKLQ